MRILDIDLDFFLSDIAFWMTGKDRLDEKHFRPWEAAEIQKFLTSNCSLTKEHPIPGNVVVHHSELLGIWNNLIKEGKLKTPFEVVHIDAHADLGMGDSAYYYIQSQLLAKSIPERTIPNPAKWSGLLPGNYLLYSIACRWLSKLIFVHHPKKAKDVPWHLFNPQEENASAIQLKYYGNVSVEQMIAGSVQPLSVEPDVLFEMIPGDKFQSIGSFDFMFLAQSPQYTPASADNLIPVISQYIAAG